MLARSPVKFVLAAAAVTVLVVLVVILLGTGEIPGTVLTGGLPSQAVEDPGSSRVSSAVRGGSRVPLPYGDGVGTLARADVKGIVRDSVGTPLEGVRIIARLRGGPPADRSPSRATTDFRGCFVLSLHAGAVAELSFYCSGYRPSQRRVRAPSSGLDVVLVRSPTLYGRVQHHDGTPVVGALVRWSRLHLAGEVTTTRADGRFAFVDVPWWLELEVLAPGALPEYRSVRVTWGMTELVITVDGGRDVTGTVIDAGSSAGISGASVELWYYRSTYTAEGRRGGPSQNAETVKTRDDGGFTLTKLPSASDRRRPDAFLWVTAPGRAPHWKLVRFPERVDGLQVALYSAGSVRGRVVDASGKPVSGQRVYVEAEAQTLCDAGSNENYRGQEVAYAIQWNRRRPDVGAPFHQEREAFTNSTGAYVIDGIPCPDGGGEVTIALPAGRPRITVVARPGEVVDALDLVWPEGLFRPWHGVVQDEFARPVAGATIELSTIRTITDAQGHFNLEVPAIIQGKLGLRARSPGYVPFRRVLVPSSGLFCECDEDGLKITLTRSFRLAVRILDQNQRPVPNAFVRIYPDGGLADFAKGGRRPASLASRRADNRGAVLMESVPATCDVLVQYPHSYEPTHRKILEAVVARSGTLRVILDDLDVLEGTAVLTLRVIDVRTGNAFEGPLLIEGTLGKDTRRWPALGPDARLEGLALGRWELSVTAEGLGAQTARVELREDQRIEVRLGQGIGISGLVTCMEGPLSKPVQVQAIEVASSRLTVTRTDSVGRFSLAGMGPGRYQLSVEPFENNVFSQLAVRNPQSYASPKPVQVSVKAGATPAFVTLTVVPVAPLCVVVAPDAASGAKGGVWSWAQDLHFTVTDDQGESIYTGGPSGLMAAAAELSLCLPEGRYNVTVLRRGEVLGKRRLAAGKSWHLDTK